jgi:hypothetical protein
MTRIFLLAVLFLVAGMAIGLLISARQRKAAARRPRPAPELPADPSRERLLRRLIGGILLLAAALVALGYAYYSG